MSRNSGSCSAILTHSNTARRYYLRTRSSVRKWQSTATRNRRRGMGCGSGMQGNNLGAPTRSSALLSKGGRTRRSTNRGGSSSTEDAQTLVWKSSLATSCFCLVSGSAGTDPLCRSREGQPRHEGFCSSIFCFCSAKPFKGPVVGIIPPPPRVNTYVPFAKKIQTLQRCFCLRHFPRLSAHFLLRGAKSRLD
jgi:hypothetical protein